MTTHARIAVEADWDRIDDYDDRGHSYGFPTVVAERDGELVGYMSSRDDCESQIECNAIKADSSFIALRLMEAYESILTAFDVRGYCFSMDKSDPGFMEVVFRLPDTAVYGETADQVFGMRMLPHGQLAETTSTHSH